MDLWQLDVTGSVWLVDGTGLKVVTGEKIIPGSACWRRWCVGHRAGGVSGPLLRLVEYSCPDQVLTDIGTQFSGKFNNPRPAEVLFDRICRKYGIDHLLTKVPVPSHV
ncbi:MAG TPA: hypothetical protein VFP34_13275 [Microlunatus sp.]|nr:hypothetical protein [Microlunatus sp.]